MTKISGTLQILLRGVSQVLLQNNVYAGILVIAGIFLSSISAGIAALIGAITCTLLATLMGVNKVALKNGLYGYNGILVALALHNFFEPTAITYSSIVFASALSIIFVEASTRVLEKLNIPALTFPFVAITYTFLLVGLKIEIPKRLSEPDSSLSAIPSVFEGTILGISQIFFQTKILTGIFLIIALCICSRRACVFAIFGSLIGALFAYTMNAPDQLIRSGTFGFNSALTAIALELFIKDVNIRTIIYIFFSLILTIAIQVALEMIFKSISIPVLTMPFVVATWIFYLATPHIPRVYSDSRS